jgi:hypothetical protein
MWRCTITRRSPAWISISRGWRAMRRQAAIAILALAITGTAGAKGSDLDSRPRRSTELPRPRDPDIAVQEELDAARRARTVAAYDLFIARHGDHRLAAVARRERAALPIPGE